MTKMPPSSRSSAKRTAPFSSPSDWWPRLAAPTASSTRRKSPATITTRLIGAIRQFSTVPRSGFALASALSETGTHLAEKGVIDSAGPGRTTARAGWQACLRYRHEGASGEQAEFRPKRGEQHEMHSRMGVRCGLRKLVFRSAGQSRFSGRGLGAGGVRTSERGARRGKIHGADQPNARGEHL